jgi:hypothetical protein
LFCCFIVQIQLKIFFFRFKKAFFFLSSFVDSMSGNIFQEVLTDAQAFSPPVYKYYEQIKTPSELGMSDKGSLDALGKDITGLMEYVNVLVSGQSKASKTGHPLGNSFFLKTGAKCTAVGKTTKNEAGEDVPLLVDRYIYVNNISVGNIPLLSSDAVGGVHFSEFRGLIPSTISNLNSLNPSTILQSFMTGSDPPCQEITMQVVDNTNNVTTETHYVTMVDIQNMDPCNFKNKKNPITGKVCKETFSNMNSSMTGNFDLSSLLIPDNLYTVCLGCFGMYVLYRVLKKNKMVP